MAQLIVRKVDDVIVQRLKKRAAQHGRSMEAEHRLILEAALAEDEARDFKEFLLALEETDADLPLVFAQK